MAENPIDIVLRGKNETAAAIAQVKTDLAGMFAATQSDIDKLKGMSPPLDAAKTSAGDVKGELAGLDAILPGIGNKIATAFSVVGVIAFAKGVAGAVWGLNQMREESAQIEARFIAFGGGADKATESLRAMDAAIGGAMTRDEKMAAVARITSLELTNSAQETAELARQALLLGDASASAESKIDSLTQILVTGRTIGLAQYGISAAAVNERVKELQAETSTLSDLQAKQIAIMEALAVKADAVAAAGGRAATASKELANAWEDLKDTTADKINLDVGVTGLAEVLRAIESGMQRGVQFNPFNNVAGQMIDLIADYRALGAAASDTERDYIAAMAGMAGATPPVTDAVDAVSEALAGLRKAKDATDVNTVAMAIFKGQITEAEYAAQGLANTLAKINPRLGRESLEPPGTSGEFAMSAYTPGNAAWNLAQWNEAQKEAKDLATANEKAAKATQAAWDKAFDAMANSAKSEFGKAQDQLRGLLPDMKLPGFGGNEPGSNGPFEDIFRAADVAAHGAASPWAAKLGLTQEAAKQIVSDFAQGFRTPEVLKLIDEVMIVDQAKRAQAAADSLTDWGNKIAAQAGVSASLKAGGAAVTAAIFGSAGGAKGKDTAGPQSTSYDAAAKAMLDGFAASAQIQVKDKAFSNQMDALGSSAFVLFETGVVKAAEQSQALRRVIEAMAAAAWANAQTAGNTARQNGVPPP